MDTAQLPVNIDIEKMLIGGLLSEIRKESGRVLGRFDLMENIPEDAFYDDKLRSIFATMRNLFVTNRPYDLPSVQEELRGMGILQAVTALCPLQQIIGMYQTSQMTLLECSTALMQVYNKRKIFLEARRIMVNVAETSAPISVTLSEGIENLSTYIRAIGYGDEYQSPDNTVALRMDTFEQRKKQRRIDTGFKQIDQNLTFGLRRGNISVIAGRPGMGKAQPLTELILTPTGWKFMGDLVVGDKVINEKGNSCTITHIHPRSLQDVYEIKCSDGSAAYCSKEHLWDTTTREERKKGLSATTKSVEKIRETLRVGSEERLNHALPRVQPIHFLGKKELPLDPYVLGILLGNGSFRTGINFYCQDEDIIERIAASLPENEKLTKVWSKGCYACRISKKIINCHEQTQTQKVLVKLKLMGLHSFSKFIPQEYLLASLDQRLELLRGLMDSDGTVNIHTTKKHISFRFSTSSEKLASDFSFLLSSLGAQFSLYEKAPWYKNKRGERRQGRLAYVFSFKLPNGQIPVSCKRKQERVLQGVLTTKINPQYIQSVNYVGKQICQCITVDNPSGLYITRDFLVTHNSTAKLNIIRGLCEQGYNVLSFLTEDTVDAEMDRFDANMTRIPLSEIAKAHCPVAEGGWASEDPRWGQIRANNERIGTTWNYFCYANQAPSFYTLVSQARALDRRLREQGKGGLDFICIDRTDRCEECFTTERGQLITNAIQQVTRNSCALAEELNCHIMHVVQISREADKRGKKNRRPTIADLRMSGAWEQDARIIFLLYRDAYYEQTAIPTTDILEFIIAKQNNGPSGITLPFVFRGSVMQIEPALPDEPNLFNPTSVTPFEGESDGDETQLPEGSRGPAVEGQAPRSNAQQTPQSGNSTNPIPPQGEGQIGGSPVSPL